MQKRLFIIGVLIGLIIMSLFVISAKSSKESKIEQNVLNDLQEKGKAKVIVLLKDEQSANKNKKILSSVAGRLDEEKIKHRFSLRNAFSASLTAEDIAKLEADDNVEMIYYDRPYSIFLQDSVPLINATKTWGLQVNGVNLSGEGETICIIDTGVDYTHPDLGNCTPIKFTLNGTNQSYILESAHNYTNNFDYTWNITMPDYSKIGVHFVNISTERYYDYVSVLDGNGKIISSYSGSLKNIWSPSVDGNTIYIKLKSDVSVTDYGFYIDFVINGTTNTTYDWSNCSKVVGGWDMRNYDPDPKDDHYHGTHVSGIAAANGTINGVAKGAKIISIKAMDSTGNGDSGDVIAGIEWCVNRSEDYNISVISMSLGVDCNAYPQYCHSNYCDSSDPLMTSAINKAIAKNIAVVIATGNAGSTTLISEPSCIENATPVGSIRKNDATIDYNRNSLVQLVAPGVSINSTDSDGTYLILSGTSMATPHVAGAFAIANQFLRLNGVTNSPQEIESAFNATGKRVYDSGSGLNFSRINIYDAIIYLDIAPVVNLINPSKDIINNSALSLNISFRCNATDNFNLKNGTFYIWNMTGVYNQSNKTFSSMSGEIEVNLTDIPQGSYKWNCLFYDINGNSAFASSNLSIDYSLSAPDIILISPDDGSSATEGSSISFEYNVSSKVYIKNCSLVIDEIITDYNSSSISTSSTNSISKSLSVGSHSWSINCSDMAGNTGNSSSRSIIINAATSSSGGGGGRKKSTNTTISSGETNLTNETDSFINNNLQTNTEGATNEVNEIYSNKEGRTYTIQESDNLKEENNDVKLRTMIFFSMMSIIIFITVHFYKQYLNSLKPLDLRKTRPW
ncbi:MAG: S8 family serine peptidase [Candidatus Pacearchaeota archaeon]